MTAVVNNAPHSNATDAYFRAWGSGISDALKTVGWIKTSDTGQIDWATVAAPTSTSTSVGYEIWRMNDSLQSSTPVFMKIEYGSSGSKDYPAIWLTVGRGSDGAGGITNVLLDRINLTTSNGVNTSLIPSYFSGSPSRFNMVFHPSLNAYFVFAFAIERDHDLTGTDIDGAINFVCFSDSGLVSRYMPYSITLPAQFAAWNCNVPPAGSGARSPDVNVFPVRTWTPGESYPLHSVMAYVSTDFANLSTVDITSYDGVSRTYLACSAKKVSYGGTGYSLWRFD